MAATSKTTVIVRTKLSKEGKEKAWSFMIRSKMPGGRITAEAVDDPRRSLHQGRWVTCA